MDSPKMNPIHIYAYLMLFAATIAMHQSHAAVSIMPTLPGHDAQASRYKASQGAYTYASSTGPHYTTNGTIRVAGKLITVPAKLRIAANASSYIKPALRFNPLLLAGTLALEYLTDNGLNYTEGQWVKVMPSPYRQFGCCKYGYMSHWEDCDGDPTTINRQYLYACDEISYLMDTGEQCNLWCVRDGTPPPSESRPATDQDWQELPDPTPELAPELPYAPYMPQGAPVEEPQYDFPPMTVPLGQPYTRPDGSTAQPMAKVSPSGDQVIVDTYDQPLTDPTGAPIPDPVPQDTPDQQLSECERNPDTLGCTKLGTIPAQDAIPTQEIPVNTTVTPIGGPGQCPADVVTSHFGITWSYQPICDFATSVKPFIIGFAWLAFAYVVVGGVRT